MNRPNLNLPPGMQPPGMIIPMGEQPAKPQREHGTWSVFDGNTHVYQNVFIELTPGGALVVAREGQALRAWADGKWSTAKRVDGDYVNLETETTVRTYDDDEGPPLGTEAVA